MTHEEAKVICSAAFADARRQGAKDAERAVALRAGNDKKLMQALCIVAAEKAASDKAERK